MTTTLAKVLSVMGYEGEELSIATTTIGSMRRVMMINRDTLLVKSNLTPGMVDKILCLKEWYMGYRKTGGKDSLIKEEFTEDVWDTFIMQKYENEKLEAKELIKEEKELSSTHHAQTTAKEESSGGLNVSYKVETKEIPKLPPNKSLKGKIFDDWHSSFYVKMCQAKLNDILAEGYMVPDEADKEYKNYKIKDDFLKNHLLTATLESNASSFINVKTMTGLKMYEKLLSVYQGKEYEEDKAVYAAAKFEKLKFNRNSRYSPETFLARVNESLKRMEVDNGKGGTTKPVSDALLPSLFRAKVDHPTFETWKSLSEKTKETWEEIQVSFLREAEQKFRGNHESSTKFKSATQRSSAASQLNSKDKKTFDKACSEGTGVHPRIYKQLNNDERDKLKKARQSKKEKGEKKSDGGFGAQYNLHQQLSNLPKGTILVPVQPKTNQNVSSNKVTTASPADTTNDSSTNNPTNESNEIRAANFLQLSNGNFVVSKTTFQLSSKVADRMSVQSFSQ